MKPSPPHNALRFLRWFCREDYIDEIEGDLTEVFEKQYEQSPAKAQWKFIWSVIRYFRPEFIKSLKRNYQLNHAAMFRHNFLLTYRTFKRYKSTFFINLIGLSTGLACALLIYLWVHDELSMNKFHKKDSQLYQIMENIEINGIIQTSEDTPGPLAKALREQMPEVEYATSVIPSNWLNVDGVVSIMGEQGVKAEGIYASEDYFHVFSHQLLQGDRDQVLKDKYAVLLSNELAYKLFGTIHNVMGKEISWKYGNLGGNFQVTSIFEKPGYHSTDRFDLILNFEYFLEKYPSHHEWYNSNPRTYVVLEKGAKIEHFNAKIAELTKSKDKKARSTLFAQQYSKKYLWGNYENGKPVGGRIDYVRSFALVATFILLIACINFMNLSTAHTSRRVKEVGVKKAAGIQRNALIFQFLGESLAMAIISSLVAIILVYFFLPYFNEITQKELMINLNSELVYGGLLIILLTGLISGSYPAIYLSGLSPMTMLKGRLPASASEFWTRKGLVIFQFSITLILMVSFVVVYK